MRHPFLPIAFVALSVSAAQFDGADHDILDLRGKCAAVDSISQKEWNGLVLAVSNGTLNINREYWTHGGITSIGPGAELSVSGRFATGMGDARVRQISLSENSRFKLNGVSWEMDYTKIAVPAGAVWYADIKRFLFWNAHDDNIWDVSGSLIFPHGFQIADSSSEKGRLQLIVRKGGTLAIGGKFSNAMKKGVFDVVMEGGTLELFWDAEIAPGSISLSPGAIVEVKVAKGVKFDPAAITVPGDAKITIRKNVKPAVELPARYTFETKYDRTGRCYWIFADAFSNNVERIKVRYPDPDVESSVRFRTVELKDTVFRRRFPAGKGPWTVAVVMKDIYGDTYKTNIVVCKPVETVKPPAPNEKIFFGLCAYTQEDHFHEDAMDLMKDALEQDLCNLLIGWNTVRQILPEKWPADKKEEWKELIEKRDMYAMSIYSGDDEKARNDAREAFGGRYLGNNVGEFASFIYQGEGCCQIPMDLDLERARDTFVNRYVAKGSLVWNFPWVFSTCGAALSCYELQGGVDFICNELWAIGAQNVAHASAEARGASRKWGPEYWGGWNAHEWQTCGTPYHVDQKYDSCLAGYFQEYIAGTSMIVLECGAQGPQAWKYTSSVPGQPKEERAPEDYNGYVAKRYREISKKFWDWVKANPRDNGTPETKIAMALGNLDGYLGQNGEFRVWSQHENAKSNRDWIYGAPENTQELLEDLFFPRPKDLMEPFGNGWLAGTPYGQVDVMQIDDDSTVADLKRYELLVFGGWNTMTPHVKDVLERYVKAGGTLVMSRPELTKKIDRDFRNYTDADLDPLFGFLPPEGADGEYVEKEVGKGRYYLFTAHTFPAATKEYYAVYSKFITGLASKVGSSVKISSNDPETIKAICYGVYPKKVYFLNMDTRRPRTFSYTLDGASHALTLKPCEIVVVDR